MAKFVHVANGKKLGISRDLRMCKIYVIDPNMPRLSAAPGQTFTMNEAQLDDLIDTLVIIREEIAAYAAEREAKRRKASDNHE